MKLQSLNHSNSKIIMIIFILPVVSIPANRESTPITRGILESLPQLATSFAITVSLSSDRSPIALFICFSQISIISSSNLQFMYKI